MFLHCILSWKCREKEGKNNLMFMSCCGCRPSNDEILILFYMPKNAFGHC